MEEQIFRVYVNTLFPGKQRKRHSSTGLHKHGQNLGKQTGNKTGRIDTQIKMIASKWVVVNRLEKLQCLGPYQRRRPFVIGPSEPGRFIIFRFVYNPKVIKFEIIPLLTIGRHLGHLLYKQLSQLVCFIH